jgi:hypothetical protein
MELEMNIERIKVIIDEENFIDDKDFFVQFRSILLRTLEETYEHAYVTVGLGKKQSIIVTPDSWETSQGVDIIKSIINDVWNSF